MIMGLLREKSMGTTLSQFIVVGGGSCRAVWRRAILKRRSSPWHRCAVGPGGNINHTVKPAETENAHG